MLSPKLCEWQTQSMTENIVAIRNYGCMPWKHYFLTVYSWDVCFVLWMKYADICIRTLSTVCKCQHISYLRILNLQSFDRLLP